MLYPERMGDEIIMENVEKRKKFVDNFIKNKQKQNHVYIQRKKFIDNFIKI